MTYIAISRLMWLLHPSPTVVLVCCHVPHMCSQHWQVYCSWSWRNAYVDHMAWETATLYGCCYSGNTLV